MFKHIFAITKQEIKLFFKSWITIICLIGFILTPVIISSPIESNRMWKNSYAAFQCNQGLVVVAIVLIPLLVISIYYKDETTQMPEIIFSQPIIGIEYAIGKFLAVYIYSLFFSFIENMLWVFMPLYFKENLYSVIPFLKYFFIYSATSFLIAVAFAYFLQVVINIKPLTIFLSMFTLLSLSSDKSDKFNVIISPIRVTNLYIDKALSQDTINYIFMNRSIMIIAAFILILVSVLKFSPKNLMNRR